MTLEFTREPGYVLRWDVFEVHPSGGKSFSGELKFVGRHGVLEGSWWFVSSDDSIRWPLGSNVRKAKQTLRERYHPPDHTEMCGCVRRA